mgnify:CR=1 FL=1
MIKKAIILFLAICFAMNLYSQNKSVSADKLLDSMSYIVKTSTEDTIYLEALLTVSNLYTKSNPDTAFGIINKGISESINRINLEYQGKFLTQKGIYYRYNKELDSSIHYYQLSANKFLELNEVLGFEVIRFDNPEVSTE